MCDDHFKKREADEGNITELETRMSKRKETRESQKQARLDKEKAKVEAERAAKEAKEAADEKKRQQETEEKAAILSAMSQGYDKEAARKRRVKSDGSSADRRRSNRPMRRHAHHFYHRWQAPLFSVTPPLCTP